MAPTCVKQIGCLGFTSAIAQITGTGVKRIAAGILSGGAPDGSFAGGASDVTFDSVGRPVVVTNGVPPKGIPYKLRRQGARLARVVGRSFLSLANLAPIEVEHEPRPAGHQPQPLRGRARGQRLLRHRRRRQRRARRRRRAAQGVARRGAPQPGAEGAARADGDHAAPDGALYIAELAPGRNVGQVIRLVPGGAPTAVASGLPSATGIAVAADGTIYLSLFGSGAPEAAPKTGRVMQITPDGTKTIIASKLNYPAGMALGADGDLYLSNNSTLTSRAARGGPFRGLTGEIVKIDLP